MNPGNGCLPLIANSQDTTLVGDTVAVGKVCHNRQSIPRLCTKYSFIGIIFKIYSIVASRYWDIASSLSSFLHVVGNQYHSLETLSLLEKRTSYHLATHGRTAAQPSNPTVATMNMNTTASSFRESLSAINSHQP